jgi:hypothetical protein
MGTITITSDALFTRQHLEHARPPLLFECANVCRRNGDFRDAQTHVQPRAGGVSPPWLGNTRAAEVANPQQTRIRATQERGALAPRGYAEARSQCHRAMTRNTSDARPATVIATTLASPAAAVSRTFAVSPLQMRFRHPRRAHARRFCLQARMCAGEMATFAMHKRMYNQERGA